MYSTVAEQVGGDRHANTQNVELFGEQIYWV